MVVYDLQAGLRDFLARTDAPGAQLGILADGEITVQAAGVLNLRTGVEVTGDSIFQIGSATKVWTATQIMQLVDAGQLTLDTAIRSVLPDFALADEDVAGKVTIRHLLTHTSGIEGDVFDDFGTNDDSIERYVAALASQGTVHGLDETWSYCNSGWVLLGRVVEVLTSLTWGQALRRTIGEPLGMQAVCTTADEAILHRAAAGHVRPGGSQDLAVAPTWMLPRALGPAGLITTSAADLLAFARMHVDGGRAPDGTQVLSPESTALMQQPQVECPERYLLAESWGLGWMVDARSGRRVLSHGGSTVGQTAHFHVVPEEGFAVTLLTNLSGGATQARELLDDVLREFTGAGLPSVPSPIESPTVEDLDRYAGTYRRHGVQTVVEVVDGRLQATLTMSGPMVDAGADDTHELVLHPAQADPGSPGPVFVCNPPGGGEDDWMPVTFYGGDGDGPPHFLHMGARVAVRAG